MNAKRNSEANFEVTVRPASSKQPRHSPWSRCPCRDGGFTFTELVAVLAVVTLIAGVVLPALAQSKPRSQQAICFNNLRAVGQAILLFNEEYGADPWRTSGAGYQHSLRANTYFQFSLLSNYLSNPKVLACPSDPLVRPAKDYSVSPDGGFLNSSRQNRAISYFLGLDSFSVVPDSVVSGDRNLIPNSGSNSGCGSGVGEAFAHYPTSRVPIRWGKYASHGPAGNILMHDGRVETTSNATVNRWFGQGLDNGRLHFLFPQQPL